MVENLLSHVSLPRYQVDTWRTQTLSESSAQTAAAALGSTHLLSRLRVDHLLLVKVKPAIVVLDKMDVRIGPVPNKPWLIRTGS